MTFAAIVQGLKLQKEAERTHQAVCDAALQGVLLCNCPGDLGTQRAVLSRRSCMCYAVNIHRCGAALLKPVMAYVFELPELPAQTVNFLVQVKVVARVHADLQLI